MIAAISFLHTKDNAGVKVADLLQSSCYLRVEMVKSGLIIKSKVVFRLQNPLRKVLWIRKCKTLGGLNIITG